MINNIIFIAYLVIVITYLIYLVRISAFSMNAEPLTHQPLFKAAIITPVLSFFAFGAICWHDHTLQIDSEGFNTFLSISKLPLAFLSLTIPFGVIVNNIHRTIQTDKQIKEAERKNKLDAFYSHRKNTIEILQNLNFESVYLSEKIIKVEFDNCYSIYRRLFPQASTSNSDFNPSKKYYSEIESCWLRIVDLFSILEFDNTLELANHIHMIEIEINNLHSTYGFKKIQIEKLHLFRFKHNEKKFELHTKFRNEEYLKYNLRSYFFAHTIICDVLGYELNDEFKDKTRDLLHYSLDKTIEIYSFNAQLTRNTTIPKVQDITNEDQTE